MSDTLKKATFDGHINAKFSMQHQGSEAREIELVEVKEVGPHGDDQFSLVFCAPQDSPPAQGVYRIEHDEVGSHDLFLVPIRKDGKGLYYQAIFNNPPED